MALQPVAVGVNGEIGYVAVQQPNPESSFAPGQEMAMDHNTSARSNPDRSFPISSTQASLMVKNTIDSLQTVVNRTRGCY